MAAPYHNLASKIDRAIVAYLIAQVPSLADCCWPAKRSLDKSLPNVTVATTDLVPADGNPFSGDRIGKVSITVKSNAPIDDPFAVGFATEANAAHRAAADRLTAQVFDALNLTGQSGDLLCDAINAAAWALAAADPDAHADLADFSLTGILPKGESQGFEGDAWNDSSNLEVYACPANRA